MSKKLFPISIPQNPFPAVESGLEYERATRRQVENIIKLFRSVLPSNYVSEVMGPNYMLDFQALAEVIAKIQITAQELYESQDFDFTKSEYIWQTLGTLVFPNAAKEGFPQIEGDTKNREFLKQMLLLLLEGSKKSTIEEGVSLVTDSLVTILEKSQFLNQKGVLWTKKDQYTFEVNVETNNGSSFPKEDPFILEENIRLILQALKPAHTKYEYRHIFTETFEQVFTDTFDLDLKEYHYEDFRKFCEGAKRLKSSEGYSSNGEYFYDNSLDFKNICPNSILKIKSGPNIGSYKIIEVIQFLTPTDSTQRKYQTVSGLSGKLTIENNIITDVDNQNFAVLPEGEILEILSGPNKGKYRLDRVLGINGGQLGKIGIGPSNEAIVSKNVLKLNKNIVLDENIDYEIYIDRLGVLVENEVLKEDVSTQFIL